MYTWHWTECSSLDRRTFLKLGSATLLGTAVPASPFPAAAEETLSNGIRLPSPWPPRLLTIGIEPMPVPYLEDPPALIPIDVGRQLFVDDFLIDQTTLRRTYYQATYHPRTPVLRPDKPWEQIGRDPCAMVFSDGVFHDPEDRLFKMWYMGGYVGSTCYATSRDGIEWEKPAFDVKPGTNIVQPGGRDSSTVWLDLEEKDPKRRYKMFRVHGSGGWGISLHFSADGIHWSDEVVRSTGTGDRTTVFYNPFRKVWVYGIRSGIGPYQRIRRYREHADVVAGAHWKPEEAGFWVNADKLDPRRADLNTQPQLYNLDAVAYESLLLGLFTIWRGQPTDRAKPNEVCAGFSRDGFHWHRPDRRPLVPVSERHGDWNWGNVQSAGGGCLVVGDKLYVYVSGRAGIKGSAASGVCTTGLAIMRRDGFASMDAGEAEGTLTTRLVRFRGKHLFVNVEAPAGEIRAEVLDQDGKVIRAYAREQCQVVRADKTLQKITWKGSDDLTALAGKPVRFRFSVKNGRLYSFWVSPEANGASLGYVAAGGPGFTGPIDTVGEAAYPS